LHWLRATVESIVRSVGVIVVVGAAALVIGALALTHHRVALSPDRASLRLTPGVINPGVTQATIRNTICKRGWTSSIRPPTSFTSNLKLRQMKLYGRTGEPSDYQEDHLVSLELGGNPTDPRNLWPEPRPRAERVDRIENQLNAEICSGHITLAEGQRRISEIKHTQG